MNFGSSYSTLRFLNKHTWIFILIIKVNKTMKEVGKCKIRKGGGERGEQGREGALWLPHLKEKAECILLLTCEVDRQALNEDPLRVFHDGHWCDWGSNIGQRRQEVKQVLVIDFQVGNTHSDGMCGALFNHLKNLDGNLTTVTKSQLVNVSPRLSQERASGVQHHSCPEGVPSLADVMIMAAINTSCCQPTV